MEEFESIEVIRERRDAERMAFEVVGALVPRIDDPAFKVRLAEVSRHHAWRAEQWAGLVTPPLPEAAPAGAPAAPLAPPPTGGDLSSLASWLDGLLDSLIVETSQVVEACHSASDRPVRRVALRVLADLRLDSVG